MHAVVRKSERDIKHVLQLLTRAPDKASRCASSSVEEVFRYHHLGKIKKDICAHLSVWSELHEDEQHIGSCRSQSPKKCNQLRMRKKGGGFSNDSASHWSGAFAVTRGGWCGLGFRKKVVL